MRLTDQDNTRYSAPESVLNKPSSQQTLKLDMCGFELLQNPFGFEFTSDRDGKAVVSTRN